MKRLTKIAASAACICALPLAAADGKFWGKSDNGKFDWSASFYWTEMTPKSYCSSALTHTYMLSVAG